MTSACCLVPSGSSPVLNRVNSSPHLEVRLRIGGADVSTHSMQIGFALDVDANCWLIDNQDITVGRHPFGKPDLLLIASGEFSDCLTQRGRLYLKLFQIGPYEAANGVLGEEAKSIFSAPPHSDAGIVQHRVLQYQPLVFAVFTDVTDPMLVDGLCGASNRNRLAVTLYFSPVARDQPDNRFGEFRSARPDQTVQSQYFAGSDRQINSAMPSRRTEVRQFKRVCPSVYVALLIIGNQLTATDHHEVLLTAQANGLALRDERSRWKTVALNEERITSLYELRTYLEPQALASSIDRLPAEHIDRMVADLRHAAKSYPEVSSSDLFKMEEDLHIHCVEKCPNKEIVEALRRSRCVHLASRYILGNEVKLPKDEPFFNEHLKIVNALAAKDGPAVMPELTEGLLEARQIVNPVFRRTICLAIKREKIDSYLLRQIGNVMLGVVEELIESGAWPCKKLEWQEQLFP